MIKFFALFPLKTNKKSPEILQEHVWRQLLRSRQRGPEGEEVVSKQVPRCPTPPLRPEAGAALPWVPELSPRPGPRVLRALEVCKLRGRLLNVTNNKKKLSLEA